jgi:hypothetical protein
MVSDPKAKDCDVYNLRTLIFKDIIDRTEFNEYNPESIKNLVKLIYDFAESNRFKRCLRSSMAKTIVVSNKFLLFMINILRNS